MREPCPHGSSFYKEEDDQKREKQFLKLLLEWLNKRKDDASNPHHATSRATREDREDREFLIGFGVCSGVLEVWKNINLYQKSEIGAADKLVY